MIINNKFFLFFFLFFCAKSTDYEPPCQAQEIWLTVFVHGIINIKPHLSVSNIIRFMRDQIVDSTYANAVELIRNDPFFYQYYAMQGLGLKLIDCKPQAGNASGAFAVAYDAFSSLNKPLNCQKNIYYTFGWSGLLSSQVRYQEAALFYELLQKEINTYKEQGINPKVRVIGYSHGGYIALNLGAVFNNVSQNTSPWFVDELVLIGVPVISDTDYMITSNLFKKVYHFYSPGDRVQIVDCLATNRFFSHRQMSSRKGFILPDKLTQIRYKIKRLAKTTIAQEAHYKKSYSRKILRNADPGHTELWSFGWTHGYRHHLPIYPFPAGSYIGYIINALQNHSFSNHVVVQLRPFEETIWIEDVKKPIKNIYPYPNQHFIQNTINTITPFIPADCSKVAYEQRGQLALQKARLRKKSC